MGEQDTKSQSDIDKIMELETKEAEKLQEPQASLRELYQYLDCCHIVLF